MFSKGISCSKTTNQASSNLDMFPVQMSMDKIVLTTSLHGRVRITHHPHNNQYLGL